MKSKRPQDTRRALQRVLLYMGAYKWTMLLVAILVIVSAGANIMGTYLFKPLINRYILPGDMKGLAGALVWMGLMYLLGAAATLGYSQLMVHVAQKIVGRIRSDLFRHTQKLPLTYFDAHTHGDLMSHFTNDVDTLQEALNNSFAMLIQSFITVSGTIIMLLVLDARLSLIVFFFLFLMALYIRHNGKLSKKYFSEQQAHLGSINGFVEEMVAGQKVEKVFNHEPQDFEEFCRRNEALREASTKALTYSGMTVPTVVALSYVNYAVSACVGGLFALSGLTDLGTLASYLVYVRQSAMPMNQFTQQINFLLVALASAERIFEMMNEEPEEDEGTVTLCNVRKREDGTLEECEEYCGLFAWKVPYLSETPGHIPKKQELRDAQGVTYSLVPLKGDVRFHDVVFGYVPEKTILNGISLYAKPGQKIAFVGSTGAGKTTIINLINRFYEISGGTILYDGINIRDMKKDDLRRSLSMVIQDTHLFTGTISDNIRYGRLYASEEDVREAAKIANADSFIRRLPKGYDTMLEGDGANLSQGQRQLLAIARAAISRPPVLILDEATSSIDTRTEKLIEQGMDALMDGRTVFVIAHRLSTVRNSKAIMVLEKGTIIERGSHEELLEQKGRYYQLYTGQFELE
ncbi:MAG TPA: ABC transporter ATP-binding protein [Candidatus Caccousia stercoris]|uniref:ABC transporter ATP-binding protein n=1 Tax=Candidatus Caccousia stercoris TaxID=2840723 RepID=A0A9D1FT02_9FIRM|nr:ABC transporter ATP-binding protein [Candidatus Caccousia stercoris]